MTMNIKTILKGNEIMENKSELIEINFLPELENIAWKKRNPHTISYSKYGDNMKISEQDVENPCLDRKEENVDISKDIHKIQKYVYNRENDFVKGMSSSEKMECIEKLKYVLSIIDANKKYYDNSGTVSDTINRIHILINNIKTSCSDKITSNSQTENSTSIKVTTQNNNNTFFKTKEKIEEKRTSTKSQRGIIIEKHLLKIKSQIKEKDITKFERDNIYTKLIEIKDEIELYMHTFTGADNISGKLEQIDGYLKKLETNTKERPKTENTVLKEAKTIKKDQNKKMKIVYHFGL